MAQVQVQNRVSVALPRLPEELQRRDHPGQGSCQDTAFGHHTAHMASPHELQPGRADTPLPAASGVLRIARPASMTVSTPA